MSARPWPRAASPRDRRGARARSRIPYRSSGAPNGGGNLERLHGLGDIVSANDRGAVANRDQVAGDGAAEALVGRRRRDLVDEALARGADEERQAERFEFREAGDGDDALLRRLAET